MTAKRARAGQHGAASLRLVERLEHAKLPTRPAARALHEARALEAWWVRTCLGGNRRLASRALKALGTSEARFLRAVMSGRVSPAAGIPRWKAVSRTALAGYASVETGETADFSPLVRPFLTWAGREVMASLDACAGPAIDRAAVCAQMQAALADTLLNIASRTCLLELNQARLLGHLRGATAQTRYDHFIQAFLTAPGAIRSFLSRYPVLERLLSVSADQSREAWTEMLARLRDDWLPLRAAFALGDDVLCAVDSGLGDPHRGGRCVMILTFSSGRRLVYKPRSVAVEAHFSDWIGWFNAHGLSPALFRMRVLDRGGHGWVEFIEPKPCRTAAEGRSFYRRQGALLGLLFLLDGTDCHNENLIAHGPQPVMVDLETLFHNAPPERRASRDRAAARRASAFSATVLRTGLLPQKIFGPEGHAELSALRGAGGQTSPFSVPRFEGARTDEMRIVYGKVQMGPSQNLPQVSEGAIDERDVEEELIAGFVDAYRIAMRHREDLLAKDGPVEAFRRDRVRFVPRPTYEYASLLSESFHPTLLRDAVHRDFHLDTLWQGTIEQPFLADLVPSEQHDVSQGDIPYFGVAVDGTDLYDGRGGRIGGFFQRTALTRVRERIARLSEEDLSAQIECIRASMAAGRMNGGGSMPTGPLVQGQAAAADDLVCAATEIGERLMQRALQTPDGPRWIGLHPVNDTDYVVGVAADDLYSGDAGIGLFLAQLGERTDRSDFRDAARRVLVRTMSGLRFVPDSDSVGAFTGTLSAVHAALHAAALWDDDAILRPAERLLPALGRRIRKDRNFDVLSGAAGAILVLLRWFERTGREQLVQLARSAGDRLLAARANSPHGAVWPSAGDGPPLSGASHGAAGIAWALAELGTRTREDAYLDAARDALRYERSLFEGRVQNWADLRRQGSEEAAPRKYLWTWCHGAPGIGIARLMMRPVWPEADLDDEIDAALRSTLANGFGGSHSLCHGDLGNADLLVTAGVTLGRAGLLREASAAARNVLDERQREGRFRCGVGGFEQTPDLMVGLAGIGYGLLRIAHPHDVPSILGMQIGRRPRARRADPAGVAKARAYSA